MSSSQLVRHLTKMNRIVVDDDAVASQIQVDVADRFCTLYLLQASLTKWRAGVNR